MQRRSFAAGFGAALTKKGGNETRHEFRARGTSIRACGPLFCFSLLLLDACGAAEADNSAVDSTSDGTAGSEKTAEESSGGTDERTTENSAVSTSGAEDAMATMEATAAGGTGGMTTENNSPAPAEAEGENSMVTATDAADGKDEQEPNAPLCPNLRLRTEGERPPFEGAEDTFYVSLVSSAGEPSFRELSCAVPNSTRQPSFKWTAPHDATYNFSCLVMPASKEVAIAVLQGDCAGEELHCVSTRNARFSFDLTLSEGEQVTVLLELDAEFGEDDVEFEFAILDRADFPSAQ